MIRLWSTCFCWMNDQVMWSCQWIKFASQVSSSQLKWLKVQDYKHLLKLRFCFIIRKMITSHSQQTLLINSQQKQSQYMTSISLFWMTHYRQFTMSEMLWALKMINRTDFWHDRTLTTGHVINQMTITYHESSVSSIHSIHCKIKINDAETMCNSHKM